MNSSSTSSSKRVLLRIALVAGFLGGFLALLAAFNAAVRPPEKARDIWYGPVIEAYGQGFKANFLFLGSSRTRAAINTDAWDRTMAEVFRVRSQSVNLGMGWCTPMEHYHGLRKLLSEYPDALQGTAVVLETDDGIGYPEKWDGNWIVEERRDLLVPYMNSSDLPRLWKSKTPMDQKLSIAVDLLVPAFDQFPRLRHVFRAYLDTLGQNLTEGIWGRPEPAAATGSDLTTAGGIRSDAKGVDLAIRMADSMAASDLRDQKRWGSWDSTVQADIVHLVRDAGGVPILMEIPFSPVQKAPLRTALRNEDRKAFEADLVRWKLPPVVKADFPTTADDFPDRWHLRKALSPAFTQALAMAYVKTFAPQVVAQRTAPDSSLHR